MASKKSTPASKGGMKYRTPGGDSYKRLYAPLRTESDAVKRQGGKANPISDYIERQINAGKANVKGKLDQAQHIMKKVSDFVKPSFTSEERKAARERGTTPEQEARKKIIDVRGKKGLLSKSKKREAELKNKLKEASNY
jgi:hypothetical protein